MPVAIPAMQCTQTRREGTTVKRTKHPRYIGWIDSLSVETGDDVGEITRAITRILTSKLWRAHYEGRLHACRVTTYGGQRAVLTYQERSGAPAPGAGDE
jgi:hypothetical protein